MGHRVLVVEDDPGIADMLTSTLGEQGHVATVAAHQREAYLLLDKESFDLALLDLKLPENEKDLEPDVEVGFAILDYIRDRFSAGVLPVIVMTAYEETSQTAVRALQALANDYLTKPFSDGANSLAEKLVKITGFIESQRTRRADGAGLKAMKYKITFTKAGVQVNDLVFTGRHADVLRLIGRASGDGGRIPAKDIAKALDVAEQTVLQYVMQIRNALKAERQRLNLDPVDTQDLICNDRNWDGYEFNFKTCYRSPE